MSSLTNIRTALQNSNMSLARMQAQARSIERSTAQLIEQNNAALYLLDKLEEEEEGMLWTKNPISNPQP